MKSLINLFIVLFLVALPAFLFADFTGDYDTDWGPVTLVQSGNAVCGIYLSGTSAGVILGTANGNYLEYDWAQLSADGTSQIQGSGYFTLEDNTISGEWCYEGSEDWEGTWTGTR